MALMAGSAQPRAEAHAAAGLAAPQHSGTAAQIGHSPGWWCKRGG
jgi:hypothetical protein